MKWIEVKINTLSKYEDIVSTILYDLGVTGLAIEDPNDILEKAKDPSWDYIELDEFFEKYDEIDRNKLVIKAYFPDTVDIESTMEKIRYNITTLPKERTGEAYGSIELDEVYEEDWANNWKKYYKPTKLGNRIIIKPSWESYEPLDDELIIELDPGMAFGTGTHETTALCVEQIEKYVDSKKSVLDVGCGSGILSIIAAKLGSKKVLGVDIDELAVKVSKENAEINNVSDYVMFKKGDLIDVVGEKYDVVVANILAEVILILNKDIKKCLKQDGLFIASGIILDKEEQVKKSMREVGLEIIDTIKKGEWLCIVSRIKVEDNA